MKQPELGKKIADLRKQNGLTQEELAFETNINVRSIQRIEAGEVTPRLSTLKLLSQIKVALGQRYHYPLTIALFKRQSSHK